ncbi:EMILIN-1 [Biomphalaria glabrata]|nr:EMILIN-1-like [Biomphalaria glabrata]
MRTQSQILIISAHLGFLEERRIQLEKRLDYIQTVLQKCHVWLQDSVDNTITFEEIMLKCLEIAKDEPGGCNLYNYELEDSQALIKESTKQYVSSSDLIPVLRNMSRNLSEQSRKVDSMFKSQTENFEQFQQYMYNVNSMTRYLQEAANQQQSRELNIVDEMRDRLISSETRASSEQLASQPEGSEGCGKTITDISCSEPFSSSVDLPRDVSSCSQSDDSDVNSLLKEQFVSLNDKLSKITQQIQDVLERERPSHVCKKYVGFTALVSIFGPLITPFSQFESDLNDYESTTDMQMGNYKILTCFNHIQHNEGGHYDPETGIFTAPWDGFYLTCLNINIHSQGPVFIGTVERTSEHITGFRELDSVVIKLGSGQSLNIVRLDSGDQLCVYKTYDKSRICDRSRFSCFMIARV